VSLAGEAVAGEHQRRGREEEAFLCHGVWRRSPPLARVKDLSRLLLLIWQLGFN
jgi:hypothetical protein